MSNRWAIPGALAFLVLVAVLCVMVILGISVTPTTEKTKAPVRTRNFGEGLRLSQHGLYGIDLVSIGKAQMRKLRKGPFVIGAINELLLEDVSLVLPEEIWKPAPANPTNINAAVSAEGGSQTRAREMLSKLGVNAGHLKLGGNMPRFSAMQMHNLKVSRLDGSQVMPWFAANVAKAERGGLSLENGWSIENGVSNAWHEGLLVIEPQLRLFTR